MWRRLVFAVLGACTGGSGTPSTPDAQSSYSITLGEAPVAASHLITRTVTVTGGAHESVVLTLDRASAGTLAEVALTLDANGNGTTTFTPCSAYMAGCAGPALIELALASDTLTSVASHAFTLDDSIVGEVAPCQGDENVVYLHGDDSVHSGTFQNDPTDPWDAQTVPGVVAFTVGGNSSVSGRFSTVELLKSIAPGVYMDAQREAFVTLGHPGLEVTAFGHGCNTITGRFQVHDYVADPEKGTVHSATISFEQLCDVEGAPPYQAPPKLLQGCFHYEATPAPPLTPPAPDPAKVAIRALALSGDGSPDPNAKAIFTDTNGDIVLDTQVDAHGLAQVALPSGGAVTVIQSAGPHRTIHTYRGIATGDFIIVNSPAGSNGAKDLMLVSYTAPPGSTGVAFTRSCSGATPANAPGRVYLEFADSCRTPTFGMLAIASFPSGPSQFVWQPAIPHVASSITTLPANWEPMSTGTVTVTNVPSTSPLSVRWAMKLDARMLELYDSYTQTPDIGTNTYSVSYPAGAGHGTEVSTWSTIPSGLTNESRTVFDTGSPNAVTVDFDALPVPALSAMQQTATGASWTQAGTGTPDVRNVIWRATTPQGRVHWYLVEPYDGQTTTTLSLPSSYAAEDPTKAVPLELHGTSVTHVDYDTSGFTLTPPAGNHRSHAAHAETYDMRFPF